MTSERVEALFEAALAACSLEPIRTPGAIQPHGYLLAFEPRTRALKHVSTNALELVGREAKDALGHVPEDWLEPDDAAAINTALDSAEFDDADASFALSLKGRAFDSRLHKVDGLFVLELEPFLESSIFGESIRTRAFRRLQDAADLSTLQDVAVREIRELTGCDRVVIYTFGEDGHGQVVAEARADGVSSYLGLHFPASDVPAQARELYKINWLRMIPDVEYEPVTILGLQTAASGAALDLTYSTLRSVSPVHREYMRHMGARSSMSISLLRQGELWGLISCIHRTPRLIPTEIRTVCLSVGRLLSLQISAIESLRESGLESFNKSLLAPIVEHMRCSSDDAIKSLTQIPSLLMRLTTSDGVAVVVGDAIALFGICPSEPQVCDLARWAAAQAAPTGHYATSSLQMEYHPAQEFAAVASGLLAIVLPRAMLTMVLWFRPEVAQTVEWAGNPAKTPDVIPGTGAPRLSPRHSFEAWTTSVRNRSIPWGTHQALAACDLRRAAIELDLADQVAREQKAVASRDELLAVVSHDLRSPLSVVSIQASVLIRTLAAAEDSASRRMFGMAKSIQRATTRMSEMLRDLLDLSTIEQGRYEVDLEPQRVEDIFEDCEALLGPLAEDKRLTLSFECDSALVVNADAARIYQVIANLVGNAIKFTATGGTIKVLAKVGGARSAFVDFLVTDTGVGMPEEQLAHIFERYWHVRHVSQTGTGLGLYIASGIVAAHGGTMEVTSEVGVGSTFHFTLPRIEFRGPHLPAVPSDSHG